MPLILLPLLRFVFAVLSITFTRARRALLVSSLVLDAALLASLIASFAQGEPVLLTVGGVSHGLGIALIGDRIGMTFAMLAWGLNIAVILYSWKDRLQPYFFLLVHLLVGACYALAFTEDLFNAYLLFDLLTLVSVLLVAYQRRPRQVSATLRYLVLASLGMSLFLLGVGIVYAHCGRLDMTLLQPLVSQAAGEPWVLLATSLLVAGVSVKAGVFTFSLWLPSAHARAMPAVSALLSGLVIKMGVLQLFRMAAVFPIQLPLVVLGSITGLLGILYAVNAHDIKKMLAFHTLSQVGYILIGFGAGTAEGRLGALSYAVAHGLFKALLFLAIGEAAAYAGGAQLHLLKEHRRSIPWDSRMALIIGSLGIMGLPPLAGYDAKAILEDGLHSHTLHFIVILISAGTVMSFAKLVPVMLARSTTRTHAVRASAYAWLGLLILFFWPISLLVTPIDICLHVFTVPHLAESLIAFLGGSGLYLVFRKHPFRLPESLFRLDVAPLIILAGFFFVYALVVLGQ